MNKKLISSILSLIAVILILIFKPDIAKKEIAIPAPTPLPTIVQPSQPAPQIATVTKVIDGDTFEINTGQKVRYIGINAPELASKGNPDQCFAKEATAKNSDIILNKQVRLQKDVSEVDKYGRLLRYVFLYDPAASDSSGLFVNKYLVDEGYAEARSYPPDIAFNDTFKASQKQAIAQNKGKWAVCK